MNFSQKRNDFGLTVKTLLNLVFYHSEVKHNKVKNSRRLVFVKSGPAYVCLLVEELLFSVLVEAECLAAGLKIYGVHL